MKKPFHQRPSKAQPGDKPQPKKMRFLKQGVMIFELTKADRAKLLLGYNIKVTVNMRMEHNPGAVDVQAGYETCTQTGFVPKDKIAPITPAPIAHEVKHEPAAVAPSATAEGVV